MPKDPPEIVENSQRRKVRRMVMCVCSMTLCLIASRARAAAPWSVDIQQANVQGAGNLIGCLELSCQGEVPMVFEGGPRIVQVQAFFDLENSAVSLAFMDEGNPPYAIQFSQANPLRVSIGRDGTGKVEAMLGEPKRPSTVFGLDPNDLVLRGSAPLAPIVVKVVAARHANTTH